MLAHGTLGHRSGDRAAWSGARHSHAHMLYQWQGGQRGGLSGARISQEARHVCRASVVAAAGKRSPPGPADSDPDSDRAALLLAGFTSSQAARTLAWFSLYGKALSIDNVQAWVQLLHDCQVLQPVVAISASPMVLEMRADNLAASAAAAAGWMLSKGVTPLQMSELMRLR
ncbi:MAG: hypothetical protein WDW38_008084 [Sanguina aurantia]